MDNGNYYSSEREDPAEANFIVISGIAIDIDDLLSAIDGKDFDTRLTPAELSTAYSIEENGFIERVSEGQYRRVQNMIAEKKRRILELIRTYTQNIGNGVTDIKLPRREQILIALSEGQLMYSSLSEFLGQFAVLNQAEAQLVAETIHEVRGNLTEVNTTSKITARNIKEVLTDSGLSLIESNLGLKGLGGSPIFLLERAILEIPPVEDDYQYFEEIRSDRGVSMPFVVESALSTAAFGTSIVAFNVAVISIGTGWLPQETIELILGPVGLTAFAGSTAFKVVQTFSKWTPITDRIRSRAHTFAVRQSALLLKQDYELISKAVEALKATPVGRLKHLLLKELILANRDGGEHESNRATVQDWINILMGDQSLSEKFDDFVSARCRDLQNFSDATVLWKEFQSYLVACDSIPNLKMSDKESVRGQEMANRHRRTIKE